MSAYYNEHDPKVAAWLRELIKQNLIAPGEVDERSIEDVKPGDVRGFTQCHWFSGIGGWSYALRLAGWPDDQPVWTGSCPCQPFSSAGKGAGFDDERHLWPAWQHLIAQCRPAIVFGEQVASKAANVWIDLVHADLEGMAYAFGCVAFPSAGVGADHIRDRAYWVADSTSERWNWEQDSAGPTRWLGAEAGGFAFRLGDSQSERCDEARASVVGPEERAPWASVEYVTDRDGRTRRIEPGIKPLAHGVPARVVRLRGYGNAINPHQAAEFIRAYRDCVA